MLLRSDDYDKLDGNNSPYIVSFKDGNKDNIVLENIKVCLKGKNTFWKIHI